MTTTTLASSVAAGALAGVVAAAPMSLAEVGVRALLDSDQRVPCSRTVRGLEQRLHAPLSAPAHLLATAVAHAAYSAASGALFGAVMHALPKRSVVVDVAAGTASSLLLQAAMYGAVLPAAGIVPAPSRMNREFHVINVVAHVAFGVALGAVFHRARRGRG